MNEALNLTEAQLHTLRHMLGINTPWMREPKPYRDYAAVNPGCPEFVAIESAGAVERYRSMDPTTTYDWYRCTPAGREAAMQSHRSIRLPKAARVYSKWLDISDCCPDLSFGDFLRSSEYREIRREA